MARNVLIPVPTRMLAVVFLEDCRKSSQERANSAETTVILDVDVTIGSERSYSGLELNIRPTRQTGAVGGRGEM